MFVGPLKPAPRARLRRFGGNLVLADRSTSASRRDEIACCLVGLGQCVGERLGALVRVGAGAVQLRRRGLALALALLVLLRSETSPKLRHPEPQRGGLRLRPRQPLLARLGSRRRVADADDHGQPLAAGRACGPIGTPLRRASRARPRGRSACRRASSRRASGSASALRARGGTGSSGSRCGRSRSAAGCRSAASASASASATAASWRGFAMTPRRSCRRARSRSRSSSARRCGGTSCSAGRAGRSSRRGRR